MAVLRDVAGCDVYAPSASRAEARLTDGVKAASADVGAEEVRWMA